MPILNAALADIRHMPYAQIINSNYVFFQCVVSEQAELMQRYIQQQILR